MFIYVTFIHFLLFGSILRIYVLHSWFPLEAIWGKSDSKWQLESFSCVFRNDWTPFPCLLEVLFLKWSITRHCWFLKADPSFKDAAQWRNSLSWELIFNIKYSASSLDFDVLSLVTSGLKYTLDFERNHIHSSSQVCYELK